MENVVLVPMHLDALVLPADESCVEAMADFTRMQFVGDIGDIHPDSAFVSESLLSSPFQDRNLTLRRGVHLHWSLPDALTRGIHQDERTTYPPAPNRWLVTRSQKGKIEKQWVVESDYLFPPGIPPEKPYLFDCVPWDSISFPFQVDQQCRQPFRYLGRTLTLEQWKRRAASDPGAKYLGTDGSPRLTALGYGEPSFAAFYPNCHSVFGFHDGDITPEGVPDETQYEVIGWYSDGGWLGWLQEDSNRLGVLAGEAATNRDVRLVEKEVLSALDNGFQWAVLNPSDKPSATSDASYPLRIACYARLTVGTPHQAPNDSAVEIAVGNTGVEALSVYLAAKIDPDHKAIIEDQLEALHLSARLEPQQLDFGYKFQEARHERSFVATTGGSLWTIRQKDVVQQQGKKPADASANAEAAAARAQIALPVDLVRKLNELNELQQESDRAVAELESLRQRLFGDWYKYMLCAYPPADYRDDYPDIDRVKHFLHSQDIPAIDGQVTLATMKQDVVDKKVAEINRDLADSARTLNDTYALMKTTAPPYWRPREPVVLIAGDLARPTNRHGQDGRLHEHGRLECHLMQDVDLDADAVAGFPNVREKLDAVKTELDNVPQSGIGFSTWDGQPWNPFLLEWEVELFPAQLNSHSASDNPASDQGNYQPNFIRDNYALCGGACDLRKSLNATIVSGANLYSGRSILSPHANDLLTTQLEDYFKKAYTTQRDATETELVKIVAALRTSHGKKDFNDPVYSALQAYDKLQDLNCLSQCLGGFNDALLMHKLTMQLNVGDPLAFDDYASFAVDVHKAVQQSILSAPQPLSDFNPIRSGEMEFLKLRLIDTFGRIKDIPLDRLLASDTLAVGSSSCRVALPPRIVQPARLNFRWLTAADDPPETNDHSPITPVCGWVLPNDLDGSLMIYDASGVALGSIDQQAQWRAPPGSDILPKITNEHLDQFVQYLTQQDAAFFRDFLSTLDNALENIDPECFAQHQARALLMGRPMALVRAAIDLEIEGLPAVHQGWHVFRQDLHRGTRQTDNFTQVKFPVRVGAYQQFNDGLVGYWIEDDAGVYHDGIFHAPESDNVVTHAKIETHSRDPALWVAVDDGPVKVTMLVDPRGKVHATSGILPTQAVQLPPDQFADALRNIEITFLSTPILTDRGQINLPLPTEPGFAWSWVERAPEQWNEITELGRAQPQAVFASPQEIREGWLKLRPAPPPKTTPKQT